MLLLWLERLKPPTSPFKSQLPFTPVSHVRIARELTGIPCSRSLSVSLTSHTSSVSTPAERNDHQDYTQHTHRSPQLNAARLWFGPGPLRLRGLGQPFLPTKLFFSLRDGMFFRGRATGDQASAADHSRSPGGGRAMQFIPYQRCRQLGGESPTLRRQSTPIRDIYGTRYR